MTAMHIGIDALLLKQGEYSGVHIAVRGLIQALHRHAPEITRITVYRQRKPMPGLPAADDRLQYVTPCWPVGWRLGRITWQQFRLGGRLIADKADLLHAPAYIAPHLCIKPVVLSVHDLFGLRQPQLCTASNRSHLQRILPKCIDRAARVLVPSNWVRKEILAWNDGRETASPNLEDRLRVVPWGVDSRFAPVTDPTHIEQVELRYGLPPKYVLFPGRIEPKKNVERLVQAFFAATAAQKLPHRLVLTGPKGWGTVRQVERMIRELGLTEKVIRTGFVPDEDLPVLYSRASAVLFPSFAEGYGFPLLEAQACGTPVVASNVEAHREIAGTAELVDPTDLPAMRAALEMVLTNDGLQERVKKEGPTHAADYSWERHARTTVAIYREIQEES